MVGCLQNGSKQQIMKNAHCSLDVKLEVFDENIIEEHQMKCMTVRMNRLSEKCAV